MRAVTLYFLIGALMAGCAQMRPSGTVPCYYSTKENVTTGCSDLEDYADCHACPSSPSK